METKKKQVVDLEKEIQNINKKMSKSKRIYDRIKIRTIILLDIFVLCPAVYILDTEVSDIIGLVTVVVGCILSLLFIMLKILNVSKYKMLEKSEKQKQETVYQKNKGISALEDQRKSLMSSIHNRCSQTQWIDSIAKN